MTTTNAVPVPSLKARVLAGASWTLVGVAVTQVTRIASNLVLARLLLPQAFGLMSLTIVFIIGLELLSDVGLGPAVIQSRRGEDPLLLDTAWSVQIVRGLILFGICCAIAWPASLIYDEPMLAHMICVAGLGIVIRSFTPTRVHVLNRNVMLGRLTLLEIVCHCIGLFATIGASFWLRSAWGLVIGWLVGDVFRVVLSYAMLPGHPHRFHFDKDCLQELVHVGRWVIVSTAVTYAASNLDRLTIGRLLSLHDLGLYSIAFQAVFTVLNVGRSVGSRVLFPVLAETARLSPQEFYRRLRKGRAAWVIPTAAVSVTLCIWGDSVVQLLYPEGYSDAGWMLRILATGAVVAVINNASAVAWVALGEFRVNAALMTVQIPVLLGGIALGWSMFGVVGVVVGIAAVEAVMYPIQSALLKKRHNLWQPELDLPVVAAGAILAVAGYLWH